MVTSRETKRSRTDLYAQVLEVLIRYPEGGKITRLSYGVGAPVDRLQKILEGTQQFRLSQKIHSIRTNSILRDPTRNRILRHLLENERLPRNLRRTNKYSKKTIINHSFTKIKKSNYSKTTQSHFKRNYSFNRTLTVLGIITLQEMSSKGRGGRGILFTTKKPS